MKIALVASEVAPYSKTGGLGDVAGALPGALARQGAEVITISPLYRSAKALGPVPAPLRVRVPLGTGAVDAPVHVLGRDYFIEHDPYFDRDGLYGTSGGDYGDNVARFVFLCRGAMELLRELGAPDILHAHDWQAALACSYLKTLYREAFPRTRSVFTIHNLAYRGIFWSIDMPLTGLPWRHYNWRELEFHGNLCFMKGGLVHADALTTVSPTYAREIQTPEEGYGLDGVLRERAAALTGILNGIDTTEWDPLTDPHLAAPYSARAPGGKAKCKSALQARCGLPGRPDVPVVGFVGRLAGQKGVDLLLAAVDALAAEEVQFVILGAGEARWQDAILAAAARRPDRVWARVAFDNALAHQIEAGSDLFVMPSRFEPCGLNQLYSLRYGTVPVVRATGGLADTVRDGVTGFSFGPFTVEAFLGAIGRARAAYADRKAWRRIVAAGMKEDFSWDASARAYLRLFESVLAST